MDPATAYLAASAITAGGSFLGNLFSDDGDPSRKGLSFYEQQVMGRDQRIGARDRQREQLEYLREVLSQRAGEFQKQFRFQQEGRQGRKTLADYFGGQMGQGGISPEQQRSMVAQNWQGSVMPAMQQFGKAGSRAGIDWSSQPAQMAMGRFGAGRSQQYGQRLGEMSLQDILSSDQQRRGLMAQLTMG